MTNADNPTVAPAEAAPPAVPLRHPVVAVILAWLCFGLGHLYLGRRWKGAVLFALLSILFVGGLALSRGVFLPQETAAFSRMIGAIGAVGYAWAGLYYAGAVVFLGPGGDLAAPS